MAQIQRAKFSEPASAPAELRSSPRFPFSQPVEALDIQANTRITGRLSDIARNGCYIDTISPFAVKAAVRLTITKDGETFTTEAKVVYSQIGMGMGLLFTSADSSQLRVLGTWLEELAGTSQTEPERTLLAVGHDAGADADKALRAGLTELITLLSRKSVVTDAEKESLLRKITGNSAF